MKPYLILLCTLMLSISAYSEWPTYHGGPSLTGTANSQLPLKPQRLWRFDMGSDINSTPIVANNRIYCLAEKGPLTAFSFSGKKIWSTAFEKKSTFTAPAIYVSGNIIIGSDQGLIHAINAETGENIWQYNAGEGIQGSPNWSKVDNKTLILVMGQSSGSIHALDIKTGDLIWKIKETNRCDGSPATKDSKMIFGNCDAALYVYSAANGDLKNKVELGADGQVASGVALFEDTAFTGTHGGSLICINTKENKIAWEFDSEEGAIYTTPAVTAKHVVFASEHGTIFCVNRITGKLKWKKETDGTPESPVIANDKIVISSDGTLYILSLENGKQLWSYEVSDETTSPAIEENMIITGSSDGNLWVFGEKDK